MLSSSSKNKGRIHQQWVRNLLQELTGLGTDDIGSRSMGAQGEDIMLSPKARNYIPASIECKSRKSYAIYKDYEQAEANNPSHSNLVSVVCIKQNKSKPLVVLDAERFFQLLVACTNMEAKYGG